MSNETKHTPGPWTLHKWGEGYGYALDAGEVQMHLRRSSDSGEDEMDANAALVAAAPELLAFVVAYIEGETTQNLVPRAMALRDKAEGR